MYQNSLELADAQKMVARPNRTVKNQWKSAWPWWMSRLFDPRRAMTRVCKAGHRTLRPELRRSPASTKALKI